METVSLQAKKRVLGRAKLRELRARTELPGIVYGGGISNIPVSVDGRLFQKLFSGMGESTLIDLKIDEEKPLKVLISCIDTDPVHDRPLHVDFRHVKMDEEIETNIELNFVGEAPIVKTENAVLVKAIEEISVKCLPTYLVDHIDVDLSSLSTYEGHIYIKDLIVPQGIRVLENAEDIIVSVAKPEEEKEIPVEAVTPDAVKKVGEEEKKAEETAGKEEELKHKK
jgi:large subunit ribosomal protein L25